MTTSCSKGQIEIKTSKVDKATGLAQKLRDLRMGIVYQRDVHWEYLTVDENLDLILQLRGISLENNQRKEDFKKMLGLD